MPVNPVFMPTSFASSTEKYRKDIVNLFEKPNSTEEVQIIKVAELVANRPFFSPLLAHYKEDLAGINPASFPFLTEIQKEALKQKLLFIFFLIFAQHELALIEGVRQALAAQQEDMARCTQLIEKLSLAPASGQEQAPAEQLQDHINGANKALQLMGLTVLARWLADKMYALYDAPDKTGTLRALMTEVNGMRLYWVWGGNLLATALALLPENFFYVEWARQGVAMPAPLMGYMSWILYYLRGGLSLILLLKHTLGGPWMSDQEQETPWQERFQTQWEQRKFALLNDFIWAILNWLCFFWLKGNGMLGYLGNVLTVGLLLMDLILLAISFFETSTKHNQEICAYNRDMNILREQLDQTQDPQKRALLQAQIDEINKMKTASEFNWEFTKYGFINDLVYSMGLMMAFALMCSLLFPPAMVPQATAMILGMVGAILCFVLTLVTAAIGGALDIKKSTKSLEQTRDEGMVALQVFASSADQDQKRQLYLTIIAARDRMLYQEDMLTFQRLTLIRSVLIDALIPPFLFIVLVFMPWSVAMSVLAAGLAVAVESNRIISAYEPKARMLPQFDEQSFVAFIDRVQKEDKKDDALVNLSTELFFSKVTTNVSSSSSSFFALSQARDRRVDGIELEMTVLPSWSVG